MDGRKGDRWEREQRERLKRGRMEEKMGEEVGGGGSMDRWMDGRVCLLVA